MAIDFHKITADGRREGSYLTKNSVLDLVLNNCIWIFSALRSGSGSGFSVLGITLVFQRFGSKNYIDLKLRSV